MPTFQQINCIKTLATHVGVGMGAASFWRGAWIILDENLYPDEPVKSATASFGLGVVGLAMSQGLVSRAEQLAKKAANRPLALSTARFGALYSVGKFEIRPRFSFHQ
jgi:hypothetical protein